MFAKVKERIDSSTARPAGGGGNGGGSDRPMPSIVSRDMRVTGNLDTPGEVHVEGTVDGDISCSKLIIGATGTVNGHILAGTVRVHGRVQGEINAEEVFILNGSTVQGDVVQQLLEIAPGASFEGAIRRRATVVAPAMLAPPVPEPTDTAAEAEPLLLATESVETDEAEELSAAASAEPLQAANSGDDLAEKKAG
ncbi:bactofilin family protein [Niveispirillum sp. KHB5.9]|uniref:bactofilin family protein n=1 Tax=Niveispirillum sp. KHB5.9 TaxID=3400269 RepID=UPI003A87A75E